VSNATFGLSHNLGGVPYQGIAAVSILGLYAKASA
jgi:acetyl-CoA C-acetyltransferase